MTWDIGRTGNKWMGAQALDKIQRLPVPIELAEGDLCLSANDRRTLLAALLENMGIDEAIQLGSLVDWQQAIAARAEAEQRRPSSGADEAETPGRHWNCRVIEFPSPEPEDTWYAIHEVYYEDGRPTSCTAQPAAAGWSAIDGPDGGLRRLEQFKEALRKPFLKESDFSGS